MHLKKSNYPIGLFILAIFLFASCDDSSLSTNDTETAADQSDQEILAEQAFPDVDGELVKISGKEGDMTLLKKK